MKIKCVLIISAVLLFASMAFAQCPQAFTYQAELRDTYGNPLSNTIVGIRLTVYDSINPGTVLYQETFNVTSNQFGLILLHPGLGNPVSGTFGAINWATGNKYTEVEISPGQSGSYLYMGKEVQASVPYVLYADSARKGGYPKHYVGEYYGGGIIFYVTDNGQHGLIADSADLQAGNDTVLWANVDTLLLNASLQGTGGGYTNTERIIINQGNGNYAAQLCANYTGGGYGDWFLPSSSELSLLYQQEQLIGGFNAGSGYWTSTETAKATASVVNFSSGAVVSTSKSTANNVRAIRAF